MTDPATTPTAPSPPPSDSSIASRIAGLPILKGLILYAATLVFMGFYAYFIEEIVRAKHGAPSLPSAMVATAAALAGVLGSAFALVIGAPAPATNSDLAVKLDKVRRGEAGTLEGLRIRLRQVLSFEPAVAEGQTGMSWPLTFGIWAYAATATAVAATYFLNQSETPDEIKALAVAFAGYVLAFFTAAFGVTGKSA
jgi:hypothetical protein